MELGDVVEGYGFEVAAVTADSARRGGSKAILRALRFLMIA